MAIVLGIDTGGTFTDSVIIDTEKKEILCKAKAFTTKNDLAVGIRNSLEKLERDFFGKIAFVSLSTTLATNAVVENRRCTTAAILIGSDADKTLPADIAVKIDGRISIKGQVQQEIDYGQLDDALETIREKAEVIAVSGIASTRNPIHEQKVRDYVSDKTDIPVVCAHELTGKLGFYERTVTCILNAGLLPVIKDLINSTKKILAEKNIDAPLMVVKGDGTMMHENVALKKPVETLLSGPAASIIGAEFLTGMEYAMILDMGGTTTDVASITGGRVRIKEEGARIGGWSTRVRAADISTFGLGGDSHIYFDSYGNLQIGPQKVIPISQAAMKWPELTDELRKYRRPEGYELCNEKETDCFTFIKQPNSKEYTPVQKELLEILKKRPHSLFWLAEYMQKDADKLGLGEMVEDGVISRISFTPTDVLHAEGHLDIYDSKSARTALKIMAERSKSGELDFIIRVKRLMYRKLAAACVQSACDFENQGFNIKENTAAEYFMEKAFQKQKEGILETEFRIRKPIIAIGAPVKAWMYPVGQFLGTSVVIPEYAEVANAVGAAAGKVVEEVNVTIRYDKVTDRYFVYLPDKRFVCDCLSEAKKTAAAEAGRLAEGFAQKSGSGECQVILNQKDEYVENFTTGEKTYVETIIKAIATGKPKWIS